MGVSSPKGGVGRGKDGDDPDRPFRKGTDSPIKGRVERGRMRVRIPRRVGSEGGSGSRQADAGQVWNGANVEPEVWIPGPSRLKEAWNVEQNSSPSRSSIPAIENGVSLSEQNSKCALLGKCMGRSQASLDPTLTEIEQMELRQQINTICLELNVGQSSGAKLAMPTDVPVV